MKINWVAIGYIALMFFIFTACFLENTQGQNETEIINSGNAVNNTESVQINITDNEKMVNQGQSHEVSISQETKAVPILWEISQDIIDGSVCDVAISDNLLYVFGETFDVSGIPEVYHNYKTGNGESIHYYIEAPLSPIYYQPNNAFISSFSLSGEETSVFELDYAYEESILNVFYWQGYLTFQLLIGPKEKDGLLYQTVGFVRDGDLEYLVEDSKDYGLLTFVEDWLIDYHFNSDTRVRYTNLFSYEFESRSLSLLSTFDAPSMVSGYYFDNFIYGYNIFLDQIKIDLDGFLVTKVEIEFQDTDIRQTQLLDFAHVDDTNFGLAYIGYQDDFDGFLWFVALHGQDPEYQYFLSDSVELTNLYVVDNGFFITGQEDGKMLLIFLNHDGEIQWKAHFREGVLRGIAEYNGRYFIAGDYNIRVTDDPLDWGSDYLYLAEIDLELMDN